MDYILIVDDDARVADTTALLVEAAPELAWIRVVPLTDPRAALKLIERDPPRALVSDYELGPGITGMTLLDALHARAPFAGRILMSGTMDETPRENAGAAGFLFLEKPFHPEALVRGLIAALDAEGSSGERRIPIPQLPTERGRL